MVTGSDDARALIAAAADLAAKLPGAEWIRLMFPAVPWMSEAAVAEGFELHPMSVFERPTQAS